MVCFQVAELQDKVSKAVEENQKLQGKLSFLSREKQTADKKVTHSISYTFNLCLCVKSIQSYSLFLTRRKSR
jgi:hypothetical protein